MFTEIAFSSLVCIRQLNDCDLEHEGASLAVTHALSAASRSHLKSAIPLHPECDSALMVCAHMDESLRSQSLPLCAWRGLD